MDEQYIDLFQMWKILKKKKWLVIYTTLLSSIITAAISIFIITPVYEAVTTIVIVKENAKIFYEDKYTYNDILMYQKLVKTYAAIALSDSVADASASSLSNLSPSEIKKSITVTAKPDTQILELKVKSSTPELAYDIANAYTDNFIKTCTNILPSSELSILDKAKVPEGPVTPRVALNTAIAFFIGIMSSTGIVFLIEYCDRKIRTEEQIEKELNIQVLGVISH